MFKVPLVLWFLVFPLATSAWAQDVGGGVVKNSPTSENPVYDPDARRAQKLADDLKSPFCPGKTLKTCTSPSAAVVRRDIQKMVRSGMSDETIIEALKAMHDKEGFSVANPEQPWQTIFVPFLPFVILTGAMVFLVRRWRTPVEATTDGLSLVSGDDPNADSRAALRARLHAEDQDPNL